MESCETLRWCWHFGAKCLSQVVPVSIDQVNGLNYTTTSIQKHITHAQIMINRASVELQFVSSWESNTVSKKARHRLVVAW